jgi:hypothetical protein
MSYKLVIKKQDNSIYWVDHFASLEQGQKWLAEEMTRPYWDATYTAEFIDTTPPPPTQAELDAAALVKTNLDAARTAAQKSKAALVAVKNATDLATLQAASIKLALVVHNLTKALQVVDPNEAE